MKRGAFGVVLLAALLVLGIFIMVYAGQKLDPIVSSLDLASQEALRGNFKETAALAGWARAAWEDCQFPFSCLAQQEEIHEIDHLYKQLEVFEAAGNRIFCSSTCARLRDLTQELKEDQTLNLHHLL